MRLCFAIPATTCRLCCAVASGPLTLHSCWCCKPQSHCCCCCNCCRLFFVLRSAAEEAEFAQRLELIKADAAQKKAAGVRNQFDAFHLCQLTLVPTTHSFYPPIHCSPILCLQQHLLLSLITLLLLLLPLLLPPLPLWTAAGALPAWHSRQCLASAGR